MTGNPASASVLALAGCMACLCILSAAAQVRAQPVTDGGDVPASPHTALLHFSIPAQWLGQALDEYSRVTGLAVLMDSANAQRRSAAVTGMVSASDALRMLLAGTGLQARYADAGSIIVAAQDLAPAAAMQEMSSTTTSAEQHGAQHGDAADAAYLGRIQQDVRAALCASPRTRPGGYRLALQLRLDARGRVERFRLLDTTGDAARDAVVSNAVRSLTLGMPPPPAMPQPVTILLLPEAADARTDCSMPMAGER